MLLRNTFDCMMCDDSYSNVKPMSECEAYNNSIMLFLYFIFFILFIIKSYRWFSLIVIKMIHIAKWTEHMRVNKDILLILCQFVRWLLQSYIFENLKCLLRCGWKLKTLSSRGFNKHMCRYSFLGSERDTSPHLLQLVLVI